MLLTSQGPWSHHGCAHHAHAHPRGSPYHSHVDGHNDGGLVVDENLRRLMVVVHLHLRCSLVNKRLCLIFHPFRVVDPHVFPEKGELLKWIKFD